MPAVDDLLHARKIVDPKAKNILTDLSIDNYEIRKYSLPIAMRLFTREGWENWLVPSSLIGFINDRLFALRESSNINIGCDLEAEYMVNLEAHYYLKYGLGDPDDVLDRVTKLENLDLFDALRNQILSDFHSGMAARLYLAHGK